MTNLVSAKYAKNEIDIDWDTERSFSDFLKLRSPGSSVIRIYDYVECEWVTVRTVQSYDDNSGIIIVQDDAGIVWSEEWISNYWYHCDVPYTTMPSHYSPVKPLSERTSTIMTIARCVGVPAWMILNNPAASKLVVKGK